MCSVLAGILEKADYGIIVLGEDFGLGGLTPYSLSTKASATAGCFYRFIHLQKLTHQPSIPSTISALIVISSCSLHSASVN